MTRFSGACRKVGQLVFLGPFSLFKSYQMTTISTHSTLSSHYNWRWSVTRLRLRWLTMRPSLEATEVNARNKVTKSYAQLRPQFLGIFFCKRKMRERLTDRPTDEGRRTNRWAEDCEPSFVLFSCFPFWNSKIRGRTGQQTHGRTHSNIEMRGRNLKLLLSYDYVKIISYQHKPQINAGTASEWRMWS